LATIIAVDPRICSVSRSTTCCFCSKRTVHLLHSHSRPP
jgi:hypothetical protein